VIGLELLRAEIRAMNPQSKLYKMLKEELILQGHWKNLPRGNPVKGWASNKSKSYVVSGTEKDGK